MRVIAATVFCMAALCACGGATTSSAESTSTADFTLSYERSGGLAASTRSLVVSTGGRAKVTSSETQAGDQHSEFRLGGRRIRSLQRALDRAHIDSIGRGPNGGCADCYLYSIRYDGEHIEIDESSAPRRLRDAIDQIEAIIAAHLGFADAVGAGAG